MPEKTAISGGPPTSISSTLDRDRTNVTSIRVEIAIDHCGSGAFAHLASPIRLGVSARRRAISTTIAARDGRIAPGSCSRS
ncbi:hypothetical protein DB32_005139 [Sandaracinus amylolyticus]|uniref:Uncharacterized protein n=1 Tax=Sandaracinus amylolyticus TaxID=927083 RepID=A0A0F6W5S7_9BACT|nr:hypothetical protein DB32_005139 [Sandaracinus amylolyticus]